MGARERRKYNKISPYRSEQEKKSILNNGLIKKVKIKDKTNFGKPANIIEFMKGEKKTVEAKKGT